MGGAANRAPALSPGWEERRREAVDLQLGAIAEMNDAVVLRQPGFSVARNARAPERRQPALSSAAGASWSCRIHGR